MGPDNDATATDATSTRLRLAHSRLDAAIMALERARAEDNRHKTPATNAAREKAMTEMMLASKALAELVAKVYGF
jgi:hypothetical protein